MVLFFDSVRDISRVLIILACMFVSRMTDARSKSMFSVCVSGRNGSGLNWINMDNPSVNRLLNQVGRFDGLTTSQRTLARYKTFSAYHAS